jgi:hypothetical protein
VTTGASDYDSYAAEFASYTAAREQGGVANDALLGQLLELLGDVSGQRVLDAACGDGYLALEEYLDAFIGAGLRLTKLADSTASCFRPIPDSILPEGSRFPRFMLLAFTKP